MPNTEASMGPSTPFSVLSMRWSWSWRKDRRAQGAPHRDGLLGSQGIGRLGERDIWSGSAENKRARPIRRGRYIVE